MTEVQAQSEVRTVGFVFVSSVLHVLLALGILALKAEQTPPKETIQIEILGGSEMLSSPAGALAKAAAIPSVAKTPVSEAPKAAEKAQAPQVSMKSAAKEISKDDVVAPAKKAAPVQRITEVKAAPAPVAADAPLETAELEEPKNISAAPSEQLDTEELNKDFEQTNQDSDVKVAALQKNLSKNLNADADSAMKDQEAQTERLQAQTAAENAALAKQIADTKQKAQAQQAALAKQEAARQAQAQAEAENSAAAAVAAEQAKADQEASAKAAQLAAEKADADKVAAAALAKEQAAQNEAAQERMLAAKAAAEKSEANRLAAEEAAQARAEKAAAAAAAAKEAQAAAKAQKGNGAGSGGVAANEVRSLNELRQMPGNERPLYDSDDRFNKRQGDVSFLAYISRDGQPVKFKMLQSSGYRELDAKTLKAIRNWKFYPGQEGWVEIPFRWDLKGGPQEMPATLRRKISQFN